MVDAFDIYLLGLLMNLSTGMQFLFCVLFFATVGTLFLWFIHDEDYQPKMKTLLAKWLKRFAVALSCVFVINIATPSDKIIAAMYLVPPVVNNEQVQEIPNNVLEFVNEWLKENTPKEKE